MTKRTILATMAALALAGGCKKKAADKAPTPTTGSNTGSATGTGSAVDPGPAKPAPLAGEALAKLYVDGWTAWNANDRAKWKAMFAADAVGHRPDQEPAEVKGADAVVADGYNFRDAFPDGKGAPQLVLVNGRMVVAAVLLTGTNTAAMKSPMGEMPPTGKKLGMLVFHGVAFNDANQIAEEWWVMDGNTVANQLGMSPQPGRPLQEKGADAPAIVVATGSDTEKANLAAVMKGNDDFNKHDVAALAASWADDGIESDQVAPMDTVGKAEIEKGIKLFVGAFSDGKITSLNAFAAGDYVFQAATFTGTNDGDMGEMKKTGKPVKMTVIELLKFEGGKTKQLWRFWDSMTMVKQMGMMGDAPAAPPPPVGTDKPAGAKSN